MQLFRVRAANFARSPSFGRRRGNARLFFVSVVFTAAVFTSPSAMAKDKTWAVFDSRRAIESTSHFKEAREALKKELEERKGKLEEKRKELNERREAIEAQKVVAAESKELLAEEGKLLQEQQRLQQLFMQTQRELALYEKKLKGQLFTRLEVAVKEVATRREYVFVMDSSKVLYHVPGIDITDAVIKVYTRRFGDKPLDLSTVKLSQRRGP